MEDKLVLGGKEFNSRFILGSGKYNINLIKAAVEQGGAEIITLALRRANTQEKENILDHIPEGVTLLPNTSGARNAEEAVRIARLSRATRLRGFCKELKLCATTKYLLPDNYETIKATEILAKEGFVVHAIHVPGPECGPCIWQSAGAACSHAPRLPRSVPTRVLAPVSFDSDTDRRNRSSNHCRCRHRHARLRPVMPWKWVLRQLWQILLLQQPAMCLPMAKCF